jgi:hypothetical protein
MAQNTIEKSKAQAWAQAWRSLEDKSPYVDQLKGWFVPGADLSQVLAENAVDSRMYLGLDGEQLKLMIVGVDANGSDMINKDNGWYIYDFSKRVPPMSDINSPLN